jgi:hypothetical protein
MNIDYTIGDEIVSIKTHSKGMHKEGQLFTVLALKKCECNCCEITVDIGKKRNLNVRIGESVQCAYCYAIFTNDDIMWFNANNFKKLDTLVDISELTEILENTVPFEL